MNIKITERALKIEVKNREIWLFADYIGWDFVYLIPSLFLDLHYYSGSFTLQFGFLCFDVVLDVFKREQNNEKD